MSDNNFKGITNEYRQTDEYKNYVKLIQADFPSLPIYLIELGISMHKNDPQFYKTATKEERKRLAKAAIKIEEQCEKAKSEYVIHDAIKIYKDASELPPTVLAPGLESLAEVTAEA